MILTAAIKRVKSEHDKDQWVLSMTYAALYIAFGGFIDEANQILAEIWKNRPEYDRTTWLADRAFEMLWYASGKRPGNVPFEKIGIDELELEHREYLVSESWAAQRWLQDVDENLTRGNVLAALKNGRFPNAETEERSFQFLREYLQTATVANHGYEVSKAIAVASELAARNNKTEESISMIKKWAGKFGKHPDTNAIVLIANNRHVAPLLLKGIVKDELKLNKQVCDEFVKNAIEEIQNRAQKGQTLVLGNLNWTELLEKLSRLTLENEPGLFTDIQKNKKWIGRPASSTQAIEKKEKELNLRLPEEYKKFLLVSNGLPQFSIVQPELLPVEEIGFLKDLYSVADRGNEIFEIIKGYPGREDEDFGSLVESAIGISRLFSDEGEIWLIPPHDNVTDWECWEFSASNPGERRYKNFRYFIEDQIQFMEEY